MLPEEIKRQDKALVIFGAKHFAKIACDYFTRDSRRTVAAFTVNRDYIPAINADELAKPLIALEDLPTHYPPNDHDIFVAMTYSKLNRDREQIVEMVHGMGYRCASHISPYAFVSPNADIGANVFVFEHNVIQHRCILEDNVILWSGNHIGHDSVICKNCFVASHVVISNALAGSQTSRWLYFLLANVMQLSLIPYCIMYLLINVFFLFWTKRCRCFRRGGGCCWETFPTAQCAAGFYRLMLVKRFISNTRGGMKNHRLTIKILITGK